MGVAVPAGNRYILDLRRNPKHLVSFSEPQDHTGAVLRKLLQAMKDYFQEEVNWPASALMAGGTGMSLNYETVVDHNNKCPVIMAIGPPAAGKTTALRACLSLVGRTEVDDFSEAGALEESIASSLPFGWDDPQSMKKLGPVFIQLFNKAGKTSCRKEAKPKSLPVVTSNFHRCDTEAQSSRCSFVSFRRTTNPHSVYKERELNAKLEEAKADAPRAIASLIRLGEVFCRDEEQARLNDIEQRLSTILQGGPRTAQVYALPMWFTEKLLAYAGMEAEMEAVWTYMEEVVSEVILANTSIQSHTANMPENNDNTAIIETVEAMVETMTLREINRSIRLLEAEINSVRHTSVIAVHLPTFHKLTNIGISLAELEAGLRPVERKRTWFLHEDSETDIFTRSRGQDSIGKGQQKMASGCWPVSIQLYREDRIGGQAEAQEEGSVQGEAQGEGSVQGEAQEEGSVQGEAQGGRKRAGRGPGGRKRAGRGPGRRKRAGRGPRRKEACRERPRRKEACRQRPREKEACRQRPRRKEACRQRPREKEACRQRPREKEACRERPRRKEACRERPREKEACRQRPREKEACRQRPRRKEACRERPREKEACRQRPREKEACRQRPREKEACRERPRRKEACRQRPRGEGSVQAEAQEEGSVQAEAQGEGSVQAEAQEEGSVQGEAQEEGSVQGEAQGEGSVQAEAQGEGSVQAEAQEEGSVQGEAQGEGSVQAEAQGEGSVQAEAQEEGSVQAEAQGEGSVQAEAQEEEGPQGGVQQQPRGAASSAAKKTHVP
ncbi:hypothetical protein Bbelb_307670 [Branchiostoma belcheri]|nr:hypothetical protein Bbelb_307670 [Branchiostoma belcheri]